MIDLRGQADMALQHVLVEDCRGWRVEKRVAVGHLFEQILEMAKLEAADLIVMGICGRRRLGHVIMGSVVKRVARLATLPSADDEGS